MHQRQLHAKHITLYVQNEVYKYSIQYMGKGPFFNTFMLRLSVEIIVWINDTYKCAQYIFINIYIAAKDFEI